MFANFEDWSKMHEYIFVRRDKLLHEGSFLMTLKKKRKKMLKRITDKA